MQLPYIAPKERIYVKSNPTINKCRRPGNRPCPDPAVHKNEHTSPHRGVVVTGENGEDGPKAFYIHVQANPGQEALVVEMLNDIFGCVLGEPATGPWFGVQYSKGTFSIFEAFPDIVGRDAHVAGGGGDIFRDVMRMNHLLSEPAHAYRLDVLFTKKVFAYYGGNKSGSTFIANGTSRVQPFRPNLFRGIYVIYE